MRYAKIRFTSGREGFGYQAINDREQVVAVVDDRGFEIPSDAFEYEVAEDESTPPFETVTLIPKEEYLSTLGEKLDSVMLSPEQEEMINKIILEVLSNPPPQE